MEAYVSATGTKEIWKYNNWYDTVLIRYDKIYDMIQIMRYSVHCMTMSYNAIQNKIAI